jgi:hypothetical protein
MNSKYSISEARLTIPLEPICGGTGINTYSTGDILYAVDPTTLDKLPIGATGQVVTSTGTLPIYQTPSIINGDVGATGATGPSFTMTNDGFYARVINNQTVNNGFYIVFNNPPQTMSSGYTYTIASPAPTGDSYVTVLNTGTYYISFGYFTNNGSSSVKMGISINGATPSNYYSIGIGLGARRLISKIPVTISLTAGDRIRIMNNSGINFTLNSPTGDPNVIMAYLTILRLS